MIDTLLLVALPASGKSELRRYLEHLSPERRAQLGLGALLHLDDYPYVAVMQTISRTLEAAGRPAVFFPEVGASFGDPRDWETLVHLLNDDDDAARHGAPRPEEPVRRLLERLDRSRALAGLPAPLGSLPESVRRDLAGVIGRQAEEIAAGRPRLPRPPGSSIVIEFARGGPEGASPPLPSPYGYRHALRHLSGSILSTAAVLYVWVTPEESRRRNRERARADGQSSILHHGVPERVMRTEYGVDDLRWLMEESDLPGTIRVDRDGEVFHLPAAVFDNRQDLTSFLREPPESWPTDRLEILGSELERVLSRLRGS